MITGAVLIAIVTFLGLISYRRPRFEQRVFKNIPLVDWINILALPTGLYGSLYLVVRSILSRPHKQILDLDTMTLGAVGAFFLVYAFVGNSIHFVGKVLWRYLPNRKLSMAYQVNEMFHGKLSHYLSYVCTGMVIFMLSLLEMNYPAVSSVSNAGTRLLVMAGIVFGMTCSNAVFTTSIWFGGYNRPIFFFVSLLFVTLWSIIRSQQLDLGYYPFNLFSVSFFGSISAAFLIRRFMVVTRLSGKKKLRLITRMLSI